MFYRTTQIHIKYIGEHEMPLPLPRNSIKEFHEVQKNAISGSCKTASPDKSEFENYFTEEQEPLENILPLC